MSGLFRNLLPMASGAAMACAGFVLSGPMALSEGTGAVRADYAASAVAAPIPTHGSRDTSKILRAADGFFYVQAELNGVPVRFLVDTGASVAVLTRADAKRVGAKVIASEAGGEMGTVGGRVAMSWTNLDALNLGPHRIRNVRAAIVGDGLSVSLIGQNVLAQLSSIRIEGDEMRLD